jgi:hypothetical protein
LASLIEWTAPAAGIYFLEVRGNGGAGTYELSVSADDDHGDEASAATATSDPSQNPGVLEAPTDQDWFSFQALAGVQYRMETTLVSLSGATVNVVDVDGTTVLAQGNALPASANFIEWTAPAEGQYFVMMQTSSPTTIGHYVLGIIGDDDYGDDAANAEHVNVPATVSGSIEASNDKDWFEIQVVANADYGFSVAPLTLQGSVLRLIDDDGTTELARSDDGAAIQWSALTSGVKYLEVSGAGAQTGAYDLALAVHDDHGDAGNATATTDPSSSLGIIEFVGDADWFSFQAFAGVLYQVEVAPGALPSAGVGVFAADGATELASRQGGPGAPATLDWTAPADGIYKLRVVAAAASGTGDYQLSLLGDDDHGDNPQNATQLIMPQAVDGVIERAGDADWYSLTALAGLQFKVDVELQTLGGVAIRVFQADGVTEVAAGDSSAGSPAVRWTTLTGGVYYIEVTEYPAEGGSAAQALNPAGGSYRLVPSLQSPIPGDYDVDVDVDGIDFLVWQRQLGSASDVAPSPLDSLGFENYAPGALQGQFAWQQLGPAAGSAAIQSAVVKSGSQAVRVDRAPGADNRWGVPLGSSLPSGDFIFVTWDMRVTATGEETGALGPFLGVEAYDDKGAFGLLGSLGVDATTLDILYQREDDGILIETGVQALPDVWYNYAALFDFVRHEYTVFVGGQALATTGFVDRGNNHSRLDQFTDADISALAAQADSPSQLLGGTAYFDNFRILDGPPPNYFPADANLDGVVDGLDLAPWSNNLGVQFGHPSGHISSEFDSSGSSLAGLEHAASSASSVAAVHETIAVAANVALPVNSNLWISPHVDSVELAVNGRSRYRPTVSVRPDENLTSRVHDLVFRAFPSTSRHSAKEVDHQMRPIGIWAEDVDFALEDDDGMAAKCQSKLGIL